MTKFSPNDKRNWSSDRWEIEADIAASGAGADHMIVVVGAAASIFLGMFASPAVGLFVGALIGWDRLKSQHDSSRSSQAIKEKGLVAPFLKGDLFRDYVSHVGVEEILKQCEYATRNKYKLSLEAAAFLKQYQVLKVLPPSQAKKPVDVPARGEDTVTASHLEQIAEQDEVEVENEDDVESLAPTPVSTPQTTKAIPGTIKSVRPGPGHPELEIKTSSGFDVIERMSAHVTNHLIVGIQGSGKGIVVSNALIAIKQKHPGIKIFVIDPKDDLKERGYFERTAHVIRRTQTPMMEPKEVVEWVRECIKEFQSLEGEKLLILDEATNISTAFRACTKEDMNWLKYVLCAFISCGDSAGLRVWIICQNAHLEELGFNGGLRSQFTGVAIVSTVNLGYLGALMATNFIPSNQKLKPDAIEELARQSPVRRAIYYGGENQWYPMPELPNLSGYDRDSRKFVSQQLDGDALTEGERKELLTRLEALSLKEPLKSLLEFCKQQNDWVKAASVQRGCRTLKGDSTDKIREYFLVLSEKGYGEVKGEAEKLQFRAAPDTP